MTAIVLQGDARQLPLPDASADLIVTSPPYFALRSYTDGGEHYSGQIGSEATPAVYIAALLECTREWCRVLKPSGSLFVNLGDKYSGAQQQSSGRQSSESSADFWRRTDPRRTGIPNKSLMGLPWRYALGCIDQLGLILRAEVIWSKPNGLPESVQDRVRRSHEQWFHLTKLPRYFAAVDEIREGYSPNKPWGSGARSRESLERALTGVRSNPSQQQTGIGTDAARVENPLGKLPGSVWDIPSEPLTVPESLAVDHFAAFPSEWPRRLILGWSPSGICTGCGEGRRPVAVVSDAYRAARSTSMADRVSAGWAVDSGKNWGYENRAIQSGKVRPDHTITGYVCACPDLTAPTRPSIVVDPFGGTGTTALAASALGRIGISIDRSADYNRLATWRTQDPAQRAKVLGVPKPPVEINGQDDLLTLLDGAA